ncbi:MBL fold metallo-hydrolase [Salinibacter altiplanensis]|uniref:MBL fold metallo-hydrolase n=1 Tax=Salinibacter altiplanensis TaxID=1803181 RepID=UPI001F484070|nr:MBL fold metallo-hydrolase [Salinibacter altiplanensis]
MPSRRTFLRQCGLALAASPVLSSVPSWLSSADGFESLRGGIGTFTQRGGTIGWLATDDGLAVVDTQSPNSAPDCWNGLSDRSQGPLSLVINTHHHGDHVGGNGVFAQYTDRFVAHANVPDLMRASADEGAANDQTYPTETFEETWSESLGDETISLHHRGPAHTGGDAIVVFENANIVHVGDLVFNRAYPFIDIDGGADSRGWIESLETIHGTLDDDTILIHGHGNPEFGVTGGREDLLVMRDFLSALNEYVTQQRQAGASLDEMKQTETLKGFEAFDFDWALSLADCIEAVHQEQTAG